MYDFINIDKYYHIDKEKFFESYVNARSGKGEDPLLEFFYKLSTNVINKGTSASRFFSYKETSSDAGICLKDPSFKQDAIQQCVMSCYKAYEDDNFSRDDNAIMAFFTVIINREFYHFLNDIKGTGKIQVMTDDLLEAVPLFDPNQYEYEDQGEVLLEKYQGILVNMFNFCKRQIRYSGNKKILCEMYLWHLIFDQNLKSKYIRRKSVILGLREEAKFLEQYSKILYKICIKRLRKDREILKEIQNEQN